MAEDICRKSAIIETYVMDSRIGSVLNRSELRPAMTLTSAISLAHE